MTDLSDARLAKVPVNFGAFSFAFASLEAFAVAFEMIIVVLSSIIGGAAYHLFYYHTVYSNSFEGFLGIGVLAAILHMFVAKSQGLYHAQVLAGLDRRWSSLLGGWLLVVLLMTLIIFLLKVGSGVSRGSVMSFGLIGGLGLVAGRMLLQAPLQRAIDRGMLATRRAVVVGMADELSRVRQSSLLCDFGLSEVRRIQLTGQAHDAGDRTAVESAIRAARECGADEIILAMPWQQEPRIQFVCDQLRASPLPVRLLPDRTAERFLALRMVVSGPIPTLEMQRSPLTSLERAGKRLFDIVASSGLLVLFAPLLIGTAIAIKLDSKGPVLFRQRSNGFDGRPFTILKFRSMHVLEDGDVIMQARPNDARLTGIGATLRRRSIDELPQLINVLRGDMSLVGPRPHALAHDDKYSKLIASYAQRQHVKPGITGLAQVQGLRGATPAIEDMQLRVAHDLIYIKSWSFVLDLRILLRTVGAVLRHKGV